MQELTAAFRSLSSTVSGYIHIHPVINEACEDSSKPTPGYLYKEISGTTLDGAAFAKIYRFLTFSPLSDLLICSCPAYCGKFYTLSLPLIFLHWSSIQK